VKRILGLGTVFALLAVMAFSAAAFAAPSHVPVTKAATPTLNATEASDLKYMREEEKVARDVYITMYNTWGLTIFSNISASEQQHMDALLTLLTRYKVPDPAQSAVGAFTNPELKALYETLIAQGDNSATEALNVGVLIEKTDIEDLKAALSGTNRSDLKQVYTNLMNGSYNHLAAFNSQLPK
jgi:hypothetical protein